MDNSTPILTTRATYIDIENRIIDKYLPRIGVYGFAVYLALLRHLNEQTDPDPPSYATIARKLGMDQGAVIRHVKKLKNLKIISPLLRFKEERQELKRGDRKRRGKRERDSARNTPVMA